MTDTTSKFDATVLDLWATDDNGPVALCLRQKLLPVEGEGGVIFPPTYADIGYCIDQQTDGTLVATIDSVASQANRMEPVFGSDPYAELVPQVKIKVNDELLVPIFDVGHRLGDALVRASTLADRAKQAFQSCIRGDVTDLAKIAPTSIVFGAWDSRDTSAKLPRIVQSTVRAWDVERLSRAGQYNPPVDYAEQEVFTEDEKAKAEGDTKSPLAQRGFVHVPWNGVGGVLTRGPVYRDVTINLVALRRLAAPAGRDQLRRYVLGLSLVAATAPLEGFLRQGCLLTLDPALEPAWVAVGRDGVRISIALDPGLALAYARKSAREFGVSEGQEGIFEAARAKADLAEKKVKGGKKAKKAKAPSAGTDSTSGNDA